jgi:hypothetical protein
MGATPVSGEKPMSIRTFFATAALLLPLSGLADDTPDLDGVLARNYQARGGLEAIRALESYRIHGTFTMAGMPIPYTTEIKRPGRLRVEFSANGITAVQAVDGDSGWQVMPFMGIPEPAPLDAGTLRELQRQADIDGPLVDWQAKGHRVELVGPGEVDGADVVTLKVGFEEGGELLAHLDAESYLDLKWQVSTTMNGRPVQIGIEFGDYRQVGDLVLAHAMTQTIEGLPGAQTFTVERYELNVPIDDARFAMPVKAAAEEGEEGGSGRVPGNAK